MESTFSSKGVFTLGPIVINQHVWEAKSDPSEANWANHTSAEVDANESYL